MSNRFVLRPDVANLAYVDLGRLVVVGADQEALFQLAKDRPGLSIEKHGLKEVKEEGWDLIVIPAWAAVTAKELKDLFASAQSKIAETGTIAVLCRVRKLALDAVVC